MSIALAAMDPTASRHIKHVARYVTAARWAEAGVAAGPFRAGLDIALHAARIEAPGWPDVLEEEGLEKLGVRIAVDHGPDRLAEFHLWVAFQVLVGTVARGGAARPTLLHLAGAVRGAAQARGLAVEEALDPLVEQLRDDWGSDRVQPLLADLERAADRALGLEEIVRHGAVPGLELTYAEAYRFARTLGRLRAAHLQTTGHDDPTVHKRLRLELPPLLARLGLRAAMPPSLPDAPDDPAELWTWVEAFLGIRIGGLADRVYEAEVHLGILEEVGFPGLAVRQAIGGLQSVLDELGNTALADAFRALERRMRESDLVDTDPESPVPLAEAVTAWLDEMLPREGLEAVLAARIAVAAHRFQGRASPADIPRIERFVRQFPGKDQWVAEGLLDAVHYVDQAQLSRSLAFLLDANSLQSQPGAILVDLGGATGLGAIAGAGVTLPVRHQPTDDGEVVVLAGDAALTSDRWRAALAGLDAAAWARLQGRRVVVVLCVATARAAEEIQQAFAENGLSPRILVGTTLHRWDPFGHLADPIFSPHTPRWSGRDWTAARALCREIGTALWDADNALGAGNQEGTVVFGHRVPPSTLTLLWRAGTWRERAWYPLFP